MGEIVVSEFVTLDGVMDDPGGSEGTPTGGWAFKFNRGSTGDHYKLAELSAADAHLLGRVTYEGFAAVWPSVTDDEGYAAKINEFPKYVVSSTLTDATWNNSTILSGDLATEVEALKAAHENILVAGSRQLVHGLLQLGLVDQLNLMVFPTLLGSGRKLFDESVAPTDFTLADAQACGDGIIATTYHRRR
jgi:dihydrofolate reductase